MSLGKAARRPSIRDLVISTNCLDNKAIIEKGWTKGMICVILFNCPLIVIDF